MAATTAKRRLTLEERRRKTYPVAMLKWQSSSSSLRKQGPIRRGVCFERCCFAFAEASADWSTAFAQPLRPVVMGPCFRRDDDVDYSLESITSPGTRASAGRSAA